MLGGGSAGVPGWAVPDGPGAHSDCPAECWDTDRGAPDWGDGDWAGTGWAGEDACPCSGSAEPGWAAGESPGAG